MERSDQVADAMAAMKKLGHATADDVAKAYRMVGHLEATFNMFQGSAEGDLSYG